MAAVATLAVLGDETASGWEARRVGFDRLRRSSRLVDDLDVRKRRTLGCEGSHLLGHRRSFGSALLMSAASLDGNVTITTYSSVSRSRPSTSLVYVDRPAVSDRY